MLRWLAEMGVLNSNSSWQAGRLAAVTSAVRSSLRGGTCSKESLGKSRALRARATWTPNSMHSSVVNMLAPQNKNYNIQHIRRVMMMF